MDRGRVAGRAESEAIVSVSRCREHRRHACSHPACMIPAATERPTGTSFVYGGSEALSDPLDPLDAIIDSKTLGTLLFIDDSQRREYGHKTVMACRFTQFQREAISNHWSAELRAKIKESNKPDLTVTYCELDADD